LIELKNITKRYGKLTAVDDLSLDIGPGEVFGFIGPNGAGKSTTMKILACLLRPDEGIARVAGFNVLKDGNEIRRILGYMPDFLGVYDYLTVDEYLQFFASAFSIRRKKRRSVVDSVLELTDLTYKKNTMVSGLSRGMQQRLGVARVLIHEPKVLLLDEPASGLDPRARIEMRELLTELARMGKVLMVSSHILSELAEMCSSIGIIERGKLLFAGSLSDALDRVQVGETVKLTLEKPEVADRVAERLRKDERVASVEVSGASLEVELKKAREAHHFLIEEVIEAGGRIESFVPREIKLEDAFLKLTQGIVQ